MEPFARQLWRRLETIHAVTYFAPESRAAAQALGAHGFWRMYFGFRAAPLGACAAPVVTAAFSGFAPEMVARAVPQVWELAPPVAYLAAREGSAAASLDRVAGDLARNLPDAAIDTLAAAAASGSPSGRVLYAANRELPPAADPAARLWQLATTIREHRGDAHVALWLAQGLTSLQVAVLFVATGGTTRASLQVNRGWTDEQWDAAVVTLVAAGLLDHAGVPTSAGRTLRDRVEADTDRLADQPFVGLRPAERQRLLDALEPAARAVAGSGVVPYPNPMGVPPMF